MKLLWYKSSPNMLSLWSYGQGRKLGIQSRKALLGCVDGNVDSPGEVGLSMSSGSGSMHCALLCWAVTGGPPGQGRCKFQVSWHWAWWLDLLVLVLQGVHM